jgi:hypothetical protein
MKNAKSLLAALILLGSITAGATAFAADGIISKNELSTDSYCHEKFPAIGDKTLASDDPMLKSQGSGDVVDFYGPCAEAPTGKDQVQEQQLDYQHRWANDYED